ncbi:MAG: TIGR03790 family protein [Fibrella sp.]|nr:TIGR03790 family protein [Armatimonadota bacterium]
MELIPGELGVVQNSPTLVIANSDNPESLRVAAYYRAFRKSAKLLALPLGAKESPANYRGGEDYQKNIENPLFAYLQKTGFRPDYIVLSRNIAMWSDGLPTAQGANGMGAVSIDSLLASSPLRRAAGSTLHSAVPNPYYAGTGRKAPLTRFSARRFKSFIVARLEGRTLAATLALVERAKRATKAHDAPVFVRSMGYPFWDAQLKDLKTDFAMGVELAPVGSRELPPPASYMGYVGHGNVEHVRTQKEENDRLNFLPGAIANLSLSFTGRAAAWRETEPTPPTAQATVAELMAHPHGPTVGTGTITEPYLNFCAQAYPMIRAYLAGMTAGEAITRSLPMLAWKNIIIGDPLVAPFARHG